MATKTSTVSLQPGKLNLALYAGDGAALRINLSDGTTPFPLDGDVSAQVRNLRTDPEALADFNVDTTGFPDGYVIISLDGTQTRALMGTETEFEGVWDVQWTPTGGQPNTLLQGELSCVLDVTR